ncbi:Rab protein geranylgeranyltransferase component A [Sesbania bispinosa]|nr:Rab protein geranylgeranyltransferase component A [Sesbania bispinosa]
MSEAEALSYPPIDPVNFDLIIVGTGLPESIIAAAASAVGKTILHLDPNTFYGGHFASLSLDDLTSYINSTPKSITAAASSDSDDVVVDLIRQPLCSDAEIISYASGDEAALLRENSRKFNLDLGGPRALFSADKTIDLLLKSGAAQYLEFKGIDTSFVYEANGGLANVPDSRSAIFRDKNLSLKEKNQLMRFFKLVQQHLGDNQDEKISEEDLESPFDGIDRLAQYSSSVGRFPNAPGALLYPIYGEGELPQAFCRRAAVKGCIYVLRMPVISLLMDKVTGFYKGVRLASGQDLYSHQLILDPSFTIASPLSLSVRDFPSDRLQMLSERDIKGMVARGICITRSSIKPDVSNFSVVYPPRSLYPEQVTSIRALQIGSNIAVCPVGTFVLYFSTLCNDADEGKKSLKAAMNALLTVPVSGNSESIPFVQSDSEDIKPVVLWSAFYTQKLTMSKFDSISSTPTPDGNLNYNDLLDATKKLFDQMYPSEEFFPTTTSPEDTTDDDNGLTLES